MKKLARRVGTAVPMPDYSYMRKRRYLDNQYNVDDDCKIPVNDDSRDLEEDFTYFHNFSCDSPPQMLQVISPICTLQ